MYTEDSYNIEFKITGKRDGRWVVQAFNGDGAKLGSPVQVNTPSEAYKVWAVLNGYSSEEPFWILEKTEEIKPEAA